MAIIRVNGIDGDEEPQSEVIETELPPEELADGLRRDGWKWAELHENGDKVGGVNFSAKRLRRVSWGRKINND